MTAWDSWWRDSLLFLRQFALTTFRTDPGSPRLSTEPEAFAELSVVGGTIVAGAALILCLLTAS